MTWAKLDDGWYDNPKLTNAGPEATALHARAIGYCAKHLTDGVLTEKAAIDLAGGCTVGKTTPQALVDLMVERRLFDEEMADEAVIYRVHDYLDYNFDRAKILADRQARKKGGEKGADIRWHTPAIAPPMGSPMGPPIVIGDAPSLPSPTLTEAQGTGSVQQGEGNQGHAGEDEQEPEVSGEWG